MKWKKLFKNRYITKHPVVVIRSKKIYLGWENGRLVLIED